MVYLSTLLIGKSLFLFNIIPNTIYSFFFLLKYNVHDNIFQPKPKHVYYLLCINHILKYFKLI